MNNTILNKSEQEVLELVCQGMGNLEIADQTNFNKSYVDNLLTSIYRKLKITGKNKRLQLMQMFSESETPEKPSTPLYIEYVETIITGSSIDKIEQRLTAEDPEKSVYIYKRILEELRTELEKLLDENDTLQAQVENLQSESSRLQEMNSSRDERMKVLDSRNYGLLMKIEELEKVKSEIESNLEHERGMNDSHMKTIKRLSSELEIYMKERRVIYNPPDPELRPGERFRIVLSEKTRTDLRTIPLMIGILIVVTVIVIWLISLVL